MGCFSFICKISKKPVLSTSLGGDAVNLFLLKNGKVVEHMMGNYDSYGRVFQMKKTLPSDLILISHEWNMDWDNVVDLMFKDDPHNGICAILAPFWTEGDPYPTTRSEADPNQGWGTHSKSTADMDKWVEKSFHKVFK